jgi:hypothetical protein
MLTVVIVTVVFVSFIILIVGVDAENIAYATLMGFVVGLMVGLLIGTLASKTTNTEIVSLNPVYGESGESEIYLKSAVVGDEEFEIYSAADENGKSVQTSVDSDSKKYEIFVVYEDVKPYLEITTKKFVHPVMALFSLGSENGYATYEFHLPTSAHEVQNN